MLVRWYYRTEAGDIGPISAAELKYLIDAGTIAPSTLVRRGGDGPWLTAGERDGSLIAAQGGREADNFADDVPAWHFNPKGQSKQGPVSSSVLKAMVAEGKLQSDDLVWKPGMALWVPATRIQGLTNELVDAKVSDPSVRVRLRHSAHPGVRRGALVVLALLVLLAGAVAWKWAASGSSERPVTDTGGSRRSTEKGGTARDDLGGVVPLFVEARTAVRLEQFERATRILNQYLASPLARQAGAAKVLLREIALATSASEAALVASNLGDAPLKNYLQNGVDLLVAALESPELRPIYERTLVRAFRQESNRRQMVPRGEIARNAMPAEADPADQDDPPAPQRPAERAPKPAEQPKLSVLGPNKGGRGAPDRDADLPNDNLERLRRPGPVPADLDDVVAKPGEFVGRTLILNGLFKIGTKITEVKGPDGQVLGWSLPVARDDDSTVCSVDGKVSRRDAYLVLDDRLATFLDHVFNKLGLRPTIKPSYKCILTVTTRRLLVNGTPTPVVVISSMEVLGGCNYMSVARHQYGQAFRTLKVTPDEADVDFGDGDLWVDRLGGEENFVKPIRRKFREMQRRAITNRDSAILDSVIQRELVKVVNTASAINQIVAMEGLRRMRIWP